MSVTRMCAVAVVAAVMVLSGCVPGGSSTPTGTPQVSVSPSSAAPSWMCTPEGKPGGVAHPCTEKQHRDQVEMDALYAEAEVVVRKGVTEDIRLQSDWRIAKVTPIIRETMAGEYLESRTGGYEAIRDLKRISSPLPRLVTVERLPDLVKSGSIVAMHACIDGRKSTITSPGRPPRQGKALEVDLFLTREGGRLKITDATDKVVTQC